MALDLICKRYHKLPSEIFRIDDDYTAIQFDMAVASVGLQEDNDLLLGALDTINSHLALIANTVNPKLKYKYKPLRKPRDTEIKKPKTLADIFNKYNISGIKTHYGN